MESEELAKLVAQERELGCELIVPRLTFPRWTPDWHALGLEEDESVRSIAELCASLRKDGFDTAIGMPFRNLDGFQEAQQQLTELQPEFLLLVDSIAKLELRIEGEEPKVWTCHRSGDRACVQENGKELSAWTIDNGGGEVPPGLLNPEDQRKGRYRLTVGVPDDPASSPGSLYCYFPTESALPLPLLAHATVELDETRKHVNNTLANRHILEALAKKIAEIAEKWASRKGVDRWAGCRLVTASRGWGSEFEKFGIPAFLLNAARTKRIIPVLGGRHRTVSEAKLAPGSSAKWLPKRLFPQFANFENKEERSLAAFLEVDSLTTEDVIARLTGGAN